MKKYVLLFVTAVLTFLGITCVYATSYGDVNLDGEVNTKDVVLLLRYVKGNTEEISEEGRVYADLNGDGDIAEEDYWILLRHLAGWEDYKTLPISSNVKLFEYGDVNLDGEVNTKDVNLIQRYASGDTEAISKTGQAYADLNGDENIDNVDSLILLRHLAGWKEYKVLPLDSDTKVYEYGDVNLDGKVDVKDVIAIIKIIDNPSGSGSDSPYADLNEDGKIDETDRLILLRHLAGWNEYQSLPLSNDFQVFECGDVNLDGKVDTKDVVLLLRYLDGDKDIITEKGLLLADANSDGKVDDTDRLIIMRHIAGWKEYQRLPLEQDTKVYLEGDVNKDGKVDEKDLELIDKALKDKENNALDDSASSIADINGDGKVDEKDMEALKKILSEENEKNPSTGDSMLYIIGGMGLLLCVGAVAFRKVKRA